MALDEWCKCPYCGDEILKSEGHSVHDCIVHILYCHQWGGVEDHPDVATDIVEMLRLRGLSLTPGTGR